MCGYPGCDNVDCADEYYEMVAECRQEPLLDGPAEGEEGVAYTSDTARSEGW